MQTPTRRCKDCIAEGITTRRKANYPGPRCATHHKQNRQRAKEKQYATYLMRTYGITVEEYQRIYEYQGGLCYICKRATGRRKRLAVDHDHETGYVRGLLCSQCNNRVLGHLRDDPEAFERGAEYIRNPPAFAVIGRRKVPE